jgi:hypothetical protein
VWRLKYGLNINVLYRLSRMCICDLRKLVGNLTEKVLTLTQPVMIEKHSMCWSLCIRRIRYGITTTVHTSGGTTTWTLVFLPGKLRLGLLATYLFSLNISCLLSAIALSICPFVEVFLHIYRINVLMDLFKEILSARFR